MAHGTCCVELRASNTSAHASEKPLLAAGVRQAERGALLASPAPLRLVGASLFAACVHRGSDEGWRHDANP